MGVMLLLFDAEFEKNEDVLLYLCLWSGPFLAHQK